MRMRDVLAVLGTHQLSEFPWGATVIATVNPLLPSNFRPMDLSMTTPQIEKMFLRLPASVWGTIQNTYIPDGENESDISPSDVTAAPVTAPSSAPVPSTPSSSGSPPAPPQSDPGASQIPTVDPTIVKPVNPARFKHVVVAVCVIVTIWSLGMVWSMRKYNPSAVQSKSVVVKIFQQIADTIDSAATGQAPQLPSTPQQPLPPDPAPASSSH
ncbi:MAG TPA: hypothetical protein VN081_02585 [Dongiaceae bacterium]|nr:hypothetical protein [Dongiaceae bacterium]